MKKEFKFRYENTALVSDSDLDGILGDLEFYRQNLREIVEEGDYSEWESSVNLSLDSKMLSMVEGIGEVKSSTDLKYIFVVGIGGSNLGTKAVYSALRGKLGSLQQDFPKIVFVDTVDPSLLVTARSIVKNNISDKQEFAVVLVSKSGTTTETISNFEVLYETFEEKFGDVEDRVVAITEEGSDLDRAVESKNIDTLYIPEKVGGRFSVLSPVGLLPLYLAEIDIYGLREGALDMLERCLDGDLKDSPAAVSASLLYYWNNQGVNINNHFFFDTDLEDVGKWYRQLMSESIGKEKNREGEEVRAGMTPIVAIGSTDLHSQAQLYFGGPKDKFTNLIYISEGETGPAVPEDAFFSGLVEGIEGESIHSIMDAIYGGVRKAYEKNKLPFSEIVMEDISAYTIGAFLQFKMLEVMYLAELLNVNAFNQPSVEDYKEETRDILED